MTKEVLDCYICHKPLYPIDLSNKDRDTWCSCNRAGVPDGWSGFVEQKSKRYDRTRRFE